MALLAGGCGDDDSGSNKDAAGGNDAADASLGDAKLDGGSDAQLTAQCTSGPTDSKLTDVSGTWAWKTVGTRLVSTMGSQFRTRAISYLLAKHTVNGSVVTADLTYCDRTEQDDASAMVKVVIPDNWRNTHTQVQRVGSFADDGSGAKVLQFPTFLELIGVGNLTNPETDPLPTTVTDPHLVDCDNDKNPGLTVALTGVLAYNMYTCQRQHSSLTGYAVSPTRIEGKYVFESEQSILAPEILKSTPQTTVTDPVTCNSSFVMVKVADTETCDTLRAKEATLF